MADIAPIGPLQVWIAYNDASNAGDHERAERYLSRDLVALVNGAPGVSSIEEDRAVQQELIACYPDYTRDYENGFEAGDWATIEWTMRGTPAAGLDLAPLLVAGCSIVRCHAGRLEQARLYHPTGALDQVVARALSRR